MCFKNIALVLLMFGFLQNVKANAVEIEKVRKWYVLAIESSGQTEMLIKHLHSIKNKNALLIAYQGGAEALMAKHSWNPYQKLTYLNKSQLTLKKAIALDPSDAEIRFLRFSIQHFIPAFLGMSAELEEDKKVILSNLYTTNGGVKSAIIKFLAESGKCNDAELEILKQAVL